MSFGGSDLLPGLQRDENWYKRGVFYEVLVGSYADSDGDGIGDFQGLISKLDYLQWLGIDVIWVPPFYESPLRDGGYDVADYREVLKDFGTLDDFRELVTQAHARNMRVLIDIVINHTSDQHEWFQQSRQDPDGPYGDYYVWSDTDEKYENYRIIFVDTEESNWTFDPERRQYFFHRFFSHQPDLNFENEAVQQEVFDIIRYWLDLGVDGIRLDAVPYLFESEEGNGESEPATHEFLRRLRAMVDEEYPGRVLLAEANQWPHEVVEYFGTDDDPECHMAFDFPTMPRIFYALRSQYKAELEEVLREQLEIPRDATWGVFLRNHDELTLEMVDEEYRQTMYGWYAYDPRMRANVGIRRRLAPLLENSLSEIKLANAILMSLKGSPILYYGDEIGMGDNIWLPDRDASRTPMQWSPDRNAGFSTADPGKLRHPVVQSLVYNYQHVNVEAQMAQPSSLLRWVRNIMQVRRQHPAFGLGDLHVRDTTHESVLAYLRDYAGEPEHPHSGDKPERILCAFSFAETPTQATISLPGNEGRRVFDIFGWQEFEPVSDEGTITLTFGSKQFYWLLLAEPDTVSTATSAIPIIRGLGGANDGDAA
ncbi:maltose alpha-D-glucosyltransferase [Gulosibacter hominis]|uniref:maltose alpha-D-glucosyltransferase n=1 Tax=Gulosibacter hominis TaxID=2770504 RepID=UPI00191A7E52|nr:maltose alpha-D-glucosyltransferase [Gulosibacter hominis]